MKILHVNGDVVKADGTESNIMELLGVNVDPLDVPNDGRGHTISAFVIDGKQYPISKVLEKIASALGNGLNVSITGAGTEASPYAADRTYEEMAGASSLKITLNGTPAAQVAVGENKITANFLDFGEGTMTVITIEITAESITGSSVDYALTADE